MHRCVLYDQAHGGSSRPIWLKTVYSDGYQYSPLDVSCVLRELLLYIYYNSLQRGSLAQRFVYPCFFPLCFEASSRFGLFVGGVKAKVLCFESFPRLH